MDPEACFPRAFEELLIHLEERQTARYPCISFSDVDFFRGSGQDSSVILALFPSLEEVTFAEQSLWVDQLINGLVKKVETSCRRIKLFSMDALPTSSKECQPDD